jgi:hypothetical protein
MMLVLWPWRMVRYERNDFPATPLAGIFLYGGLAELATPMLSLGYRHNGWHQWSNSVF